MRRVIVLYNAYKLRLDKIFRLGYSTFLFFQNKTINLSFNFDASIFFASHHPVLMYS